MPRARKLKASRKCSTVGAAKGRIIAGNMLWMLVVGAAHACALTLFQTRFARRKRPSRQSCEQNCLNIIWISNSSKSIQPRQGRVNLTQH